MPALSSEKTLPGLPSGLTTRLLRNAMANLLSAAQAIDLRQKADRLGAGTKPVYRAIRKISLFVQEDRAPDKDIGAVCELIASRNSLFLN